MFLFAILGSMLFLALNLYYLFVDYFQYPVTTSIVMVRRESMELPAVTVCVDGPRVRFNAVSVFILCSLFNKS